MHRGVATFTLDYGKCPKWLFERMVKLSREIVEIMIMEYGADEFIKRMGDPVWLQSLGTVLAFDWNASGLTTILTAALKEAIRGAEKDLGIFICGGKGKTSLKTPEQIQNWAYRLSLSDNFAKSLVHNSKMSAKVDSSLVQDDYTLYHHSFMFSKNGSWTVIQQGMNTETKTARRYHWHSDKAKDLIEEPHSGISSQILTNSPVLNLTSKDSSDNRKISLELINSNFNTVMKDIQILRKHSSSLSRMKSVKIAENQLTLLELSDKDFNSHPLLKENFSKSKYLEKIIYILTDKKPENFEKLIMTPGVGGKTLRALSLVSEVIYGAPASYKDPARYSFAHGGKDSIPFPVDTETYDNSIEILKKIINKSRISLSDKKQIFKIGLST